MSEKVHIHRQLPGGEYEEVLVDAVSDPRVRQNRDKTWATRSKAEYIGWRMGKAPRPKRAPVSDAKPQTVPESVTAELDLSEDLLD